MAIWGNLENNIMSGATTAVTNYNNTGSFTKKGTAVGNFLRSIFKRKDKRTGSESRGDKNTQTTLFDRISYGISDGINDITDRIKLPEFQTKVGVESNTMIMVFILGLLLFFGLKKK